MKHFVALVLGVCGIAGAAQADWQTCNVFGVSDGDTVKVRCGEQPEARVRLAEIDAPESKQAFGQVSKKALSDMVYRQRVQLYVVDVDRYGRWVAHIARNGQSVNFRMVDLGLAWCYDRYVRDRSCYDRQSAASSAGRGLWQGENPIQPWEFRRRK
ncbi:thermonuclease family protein (plasmid) [Flagellatimonas centrodinii]|uniref:thermonuclease family protein n=1 Tax=Flagellatimonas centrodinii TaxID=2806210 RepID=UPI001FF87960|nr:thermonuclease family protein [Flagellatimonas centrodinii]ULQ48407.1 thermonuclease family protein [Flagellatimonas centrodinii]